MFEFSKLISPACILNMKTIRQHPKECVDSGLKLKKKKAQLSVFNFVETVANYRSHG